MTTRLLFCAICVAISAIAAMAVWASSPDTRKNTVSDKTATASKPVNKAPTDRALPPKFSGRILHITKKTVAPGDVTISISVDPPRGHHLTDLAPSFLSWYSDSPKAASFLRSFESYVPGTIRFPFDLAVKTGSGQSKLVFDVVAYFCENKSNVCMFDKFRIELPIEVIPDGPRKIFISADIENPDERE